MTQTKYTHSMTLRLTRELDELLTEASYDRRVSKSDFIRSAIRQSLNNQWTTKTTGARQ
jgi:Arc/MetJ-type ribon-helix-helix transcriptional regulator